MTEIFRAGQDTMAHASLGARLGPVGGNGGGNANQNGWRIARIYRNDPDVPGALSPFYWQPRPMATIVNDKLHDFPGDNGNAYWG